MQDSTVQGYAERLGELLQLTFPTMVDGRRAELIRSLYAIRCIHYLTVHASGKFPTLPRCPSAELRLPLSSEARHAAHQLADGMKADDVSAVVKALGDLSVFGLIPITSELINHLRQCARTIVGIEQLIPAVELAVLAVEAGERDPAGAIVEDCLVLNPGPLELHDLHGVMGMIDLHEKNYSQAREHLMTSVRVCMGLRGAVMARGPSPSLLLAKQFLKVGDGDIVVRYLEKCAEVWTIRSAGIRGWIGKIEQQQLVLVAERFVIHDLSTMMLKLRALASMSRLASRLSAEEWDRILASMKREATRSVEGRLDRSEN